MAGGGSSSSQSRPVDMTPQAFKNLQQPVANVVASLLGFSPSGGVGGQSSGSGATPQGPTNPIGVAAGAAGGTPGMQAPGTGSMYNPVPAGAGGGDSDLTPHMPIPGSTSTPSTGAGTPGSTSYTGGPVAGNPNSVLSGIPSYGGQVSAPITGNESDLLTQLMGTTGANNGAQSALNSILSGTSGQVSGGAVDPNSVQSAFNAGPNNPLLQAYITAAQRGTMDNLAHTLVSNGSQFTANGQFIQPTGSSAFDRAQALATQSAANAAGDIAANIGYQGYQTDQTLNQQTGAQNASNVLSALQGNQSTDLSASNANAQNAISAASAQGNLSSQDVQSLVSNLQAQALPRLIEQYGLDQGLQMFNNQVNDLMTILQTGAGVSSPVIANTSSSSSTQKPNLL